MFLAQHAYLPLLNIIFINSVITANALLLDRNYRGLTQQPLEIGSSHFEWKNVTPSEHLAFTACYDGLQCARLDVPLNWNSSTEANEGRAAIAIVKLPAKVPVTHKNYGGAVVMNPGGPGESGVHQVIVGGRHIQTILDAPDGKYFDIIGFDPRGVNNSTPYLTCFPDAFTLQMWHLRQADYAIRWESGYSFALEWARAESLGQSCTKDEDARYVNTAQVVEDMVEIIERHGEWRQIEAERLLLGESVADQDEIRIRTVWEKGYEKLQYWGVSYGSLLGQTFAAMHPSRVKRLVIDGIVDPDDYYNGEWLANLLDTDRIMTQLCTYCFEAGAKCPLYSGTSGKDIETAVEQMVFGLKEQPIVLPAVEDRGPEIITFGDVLLHALGAMAFPFAYAEGFFGLLAELSQGNLTGIAASKQSSLDSARSSAKCGNLRTASGLCASGYYVALLGVTQTIECMDNVGINRALTKHDFDIYLERLTKQSKWFSAGWAPHKMSCIGVKTEAAWKFEGPIAGEVAYPLLIIGNTYDSVTPLQNAHRVSGLFPGSVVLQQDSEGHCSYANPSLCTAHAVRDYFQTGKLPPNGTICPPQYRPFIGCIERDSSGNCKPMDAEDEVVWKALEGITRVWP